MNFKQFPRRPLLGTAALATFVIVAFLAGKGIAERETRAEVDSLATKLALLESQQAVLQDTYLSGDPRRRAALAANLGYRPQAPEPEVEMSPETVMQNIRAEQQQLEQDYAAERLDPAWSGTTMRKVQDAIVNISAEPGAPMPAAAQVDCRSRSCRIVLNLAHAGESGQLTDNMMADLSSILSQATIVEIPSSDGERIDVYIYAKAGSKS